MILFKISVNTFFGSATLKLADLSVNKVFLGTQALDLQDGLNDTKLEIAQVKRAMIRAAKEVILMANSSKWDDTGFIKIAPLAGSIP